MGRLPARARTDGTPRGRVSLGASAASSASCSWIVGSTVLRLRDDICPVVPLFDACRERVSPCLSAVDVSEPAKLDTESELERALRVSQEFWDEAVARHRLAPPDAGFSDRLDRLAAAARAQAQLCQIAHYDGYKWTPHTGTPEPPWELHPESGRRGPVELWRIFDQGVAEFAARRERHRPARRFPGTRLDREGGTRSIPGRCTSGPRERAATALRGRHRRVLDQGHGSVGRPADSAS